MDFKFFESLSMSDARAFLANFLSVESKAMGEMFDQAKAEGVELAFSTSSIKPMFTWVLRSIKSNPKAPDLTLPEWITGTESYKRGLFVFDEPSKILVLRAAYFVGASFISEYPHLKWDTGDCETALMNMPVIKGFRMDLELPAILVAENAISRIHAQNHPLETIDTMVKSWIGHI